MTDLNALAVAAKRDPIAYEDLYRKLQPGFAKQAQTVASRNSLVDPAELESMYDDRFIDLIQRYDASRGDFENLLRNAMRRATMSCLRHAYSTKDRPSELMEPTFLERRGVKQSAKKYASGPYGNQLNVASAEDKHLLSQSEVELVEKLRRSCASKQDVAAALMLATASYTDLEIARRLGHRGGDKAAGMFMCRLKGRLMRLMGVS